jgi:hypothetical protein
MSVTVFLLQNIKKKLFKIKISTLIWKCTKAHYLPFEWISFLSIQVCFDERLNPEIRSKKKINNENDSLIFYFPKNIPKLNTTVQKMLKWLERHLLIFFNCSEAFTEHKELAFNFVIKLWTFFAFWVSQLNNIIFKLSMKLPEKN